MLLFGCLLTNVTKDAPSGCQRAQTLATAQNPNMVGFFVACTTLTKVWKRR